VIYKNKTIMAPKKTKKRIKDKYGRETIVVIKKQMSTLWIRITMIMGAGECVHGVINLNIMDVIIINLIQNVVY